MTSLGWKTVVIEQHASLGYTQGCMEIEGERCSTVPLAQMSTLLINTLQVRISAHLLNELLRRNIKVVFCDEKRNPAGELIGYHEHFRQSGILSNQISWTQPQKALIWQKIIRLKINTQAGLLKYLGITPPEKMVEYSGSVLPGDISNREGQAARLYFSALFGSSFVRGSASETNAALNYGYSILLSSVNRLVTCSGHLTNLGINHHGETNPFNLSCDLMEPFRPFVDELVFLNNGRALDSAFKRELASLIYRPVLFRGSETHLHTALELYVESTLKNITNEHYSIGELRFI